MEAIMTIEEKHLPEEYTNIICYSNAVEGLDQFYIIRSNLETIEDINKWVRVFGINTNTRWNVRDSLPQGKQCVCSKTFVCHHSQFNKVPSNANKKGKSKNLECSATIHVRIRLSTKLTRKRDLYMKSGLCGIIRIRKSHNHLLQSAQVLQSLNSEKRDVFEDYFKDGLVVADAKAHHENLLLHDPNIKEVDLANARQNPTRISVSYWFNKWRKQNLGPRSVPELIEKLKERQVIYKSRGISISYSEDPFTVVILTPVMKRSHSLPMSSELVFLDTTFSNDREYSLILIFTSCPAGAALLGILICKGQSVESYTSAFNLLKFTYKEAFGGVSPKIFITDDLPEEIEALETVWPKRNNLLNVFSVLRTVWKWLWDHQNKIKRDHRLILMDSFKQMVYSEDYTSLKENYAICLHNGTSYQYAHWNNDIIARHWSTREKWCLAYRDELTRYPHTNNFTENTFRLIKDQILSRLKPNNVISIVDFCCTVLETTCSQRYKSFANFERRDSYEFFLDMLPEVKYLKKDDIVPVTDTTYSVPSEINSNTTVYSSDILAGCCSCHTGKTGALCKHQSAIFQNFSIINDDFPCVIPHDRYSIAKLAFGDNTPDLSLYDDLENIKMEIYENSVTDQEDSMNIDDPTTKTEDDANYLISVEDSDVTEETIENLARNCADVLTEKINLYSTPKTLILLRTLEDTLNRITSQNELNDFLNISERLYSK